MFIPVAPYRYLLPNLYLSAADIANPDLIIMYNICIAPYNTIL